MKITHISKNAYLPIFSCAALFGLSCALTFPFVPSFVSADTTQATTSGVTGISVDLSDSITLGLSSSSADLDITPTATPSLVTNSVTASVTTNVASGYTLTVASNSSETSLVHASSSSTKIPTLAADTTAATFPIPSDAIGVWGLSKDGTNYVGLPSSSSSYTLKTTSSAATSTDKTTVTFGAKATTEARSGTYSRAMVFSATASSPTPPASLCGSTMAMQDITDTYIKSMTFDTQVQMCDNRDGKLYWVARLADDNVWMTQNLDLVLSTSTTLTSADSDVTSPWTPNNNTQTTQYNGIGSSAEWNGDFNTKDHSYRPASDANAGTSGDFGNDGDIYFSPVIMTNGTTMSSYKNETECVAGGYTAEQCAHWNVGTFYSWRAATAGSGNGDVSTVTNVTSSICPKGWHLPSSTSSGEFQALVTAGSITASNITAAPYYFLRSGYYDGDYGAVYLTGNYGDNWSRTSYSGTNYAYSLYFNSSNVYPSFNDYRYYGLTVRCLAGS